MWFVVSAPRRESVSERAFAVPLSLVGMPRDLAITTPVPDTVSVRLRGRNSDLRALSSQESDVGSSNCIRVRLQLETSFGGKDDSQIIVLDVLMQRAR